MKYTMNIEDIYFKLVESSQKTHEYRLNDEKRQAIRINDIIELINNSDNNLKVEVKVIDVKVYPSWELALEKTYKQDFAGLYSSLKETINACSKFYDEEKIRKYGIVVFKIKKTSK